MLAAARKLLQQFLDSIGKGEVQQWPVLKGNDVAIVELRTSAVLDAEIGTCIPIKTGGYVKKFRDYSWVQWQWFPDAEPPAEEPPPE